MTVPARVHGRRSRACSGFTLLEVLAAIALLAIVFVVGVGALGKAAQNAARSAALATAVEHAQSLLAGQGLAKPLGDGRSTGTFDDGMAWTLDVHVLPRPTGVAEGGLPAPGPRGGVLAQAPAIDLYRLDVAVRYGAGRTLRLSTERAQAAPARRP